MSRFVFCLSIILLVSGNLFAQYSLNRCVDIVGSIPDEMKFEGRVAFREQQLVVLRASQIKKPGRWSRLFSMSAQQDYETHSRIQTEIIQVQDELKQLRLLQDQILAARRRDALSPEVEARLITKLLSNEEYRRSLQVIHQRQTAPQSTTKEQDFLTSCLYYMAWGPDFSLMTTPFHHWMILNMLMGRENEGHLVDIIGQLNRTVENYEDHRSSLTPSVMTHIEDVWSQNYDPIRTEINNTSSQEVQFALQEALNDGVISEAEREDLHALQSVYADGVVTSDERSWLDSHDSHNKDNTTNTSDDSSGKDSGGSGDNGGSNDNGGGYDGGGSDNGSSSDF